MGDGLGEPGGENGREAALEMAGFATHVIKTFINSRNNIA